MERLLGANMAEGFGGSTLRIAYAWQRAGDSLSPPMYCKSLVGTDKGSAEANNAAAGVRPTDAQVVPCASQLRAASGLNPVLLQVSVLCCFDSQLLLL